MIATTISNSISEKPFCLRIGLFPSSPEKHLKTFTGQHDQLP
jgi:hypothetical protein